MAKRVGTGIENFKTLIDKGYYFVDKTFFLKDLVDPVINGKKSDVPSIDGVFLFLRPRRFGKTLTLSMLRYFFDMDEKDNAYLFDGLAISKEKELCEEFQNKMPVISITFKDVSGLDREKFLSNFNDALKGEYKRHAYVRDVLSDESDIESFDRIFNGKALETDLYKYLSLLENALYSYHHVKPLVLIDEYDVPLNAAHTIGCYDEIREIISQMFSKGLKTKDNLQAAVLTGCLKIARNQIFTGLNNLTVYSVTRPNYSSVFGFTEEETTSLLKYYGLESRMPDVKKSYDGYHFSRSEMYNPHSLLNFITDSLVEKDVSCGDYWARSSGNGILLEMLASTKGNSELKEIFEKLLSGESVDTIVDDTIVYATMMESVPAIVGTLLFTGYVTAVKEFGDNAYRVKVPNGEVLISLRRLVDGYNREESTEMTPYLIQTLLDGNTEKAQSYINDLISTVLVVRDKNTVENNFHYFLAALFALTKVPKWKVISQDQGLRGFADWALVSNDNHAIIIEEKNAKTLDEMDRKFQEGTEQMEKSAYREKYERLRFKVHSFVIVYFEMMAYIRQVG